MKKIMLCLFTCSLTVWNGWAQGETNTEFGPINTGAANFLTIPTNARNAGMGGVGVALPGDDAAIFSNASLVLQDKESQGGMTYTFSPWMRDYESGYSLNSLGAYYRINERSAVLGGFRYFNYPKISITEGNGVSGRTMRPKEWAIDLGYAYQWNANLALSGTIRYIHSDMGNIGGAQPANAIAFDLGASYKGKLSLVKGASWNMGAQVSNVGTQIKYLETKEYLPVMAKIGGSVDLPFSEIHRLIVATDLGYKFASTDVTALHVSAGAEYIFREYFKLRGGYHYGDKEKGDASYATAGAGFQRYRAHVDFSWLFAASDCPLRNTFWISLGYSF